MAKNINIRKPHGMEQAAAEARMAELMTELETRFGVKVERKGGITAVKGKGVDGTAKIDGGDIVIDMKLGLPASMIAGRIEEGVNKSIEQHFSA